MKTSNMILAGVMLGLFMFATAAPASPQEQDPEFTLMNACPFDIFVREAVAWGPGSRPGEKCEGFGETPTYVLHPGVIMRSLIPVRKDTCGHSVKLSRTPQGPVYQFEFNYSREDNMMWYNLSHWDGHPFQDVIRQFGTHTWNCPIQSCEAGQDGATCDDPQLGVCGEITYWMSIVCEHLAGWQSSMEKQEEWLTKAKKLETLPIVEAKVVR